MPVKAIGVFAGGGAKGIAHVGAYAAALCNGVQFEYVAGTSAGSIVAALVAAGYKPDEIYDPNTNTGLLTEDFIEILGPYRWRAIKAFSRGFFSLALRFWLWPAALYVTWKLIRYRGIFDSQKLTAIFEKWLRNKITPLNGIDVTFSDLNNLKIVGTSLESKSAIIWSHSETPDFPVAQAISASIAIPIIFYPVKVLMSTTTGSEKKLSYSVVDTVVDGGMVSNFPIWVFDAERGQDWDLATFAFSFVNRQKGQVNSWFCYLKRLLLVSVSGDSILETRQVDHLALVPLNVSVGTLDFDADVSQKKILFKEGYDCSHKAFRNTIFPQDPVSVSILLGALSMELQTRIGGLNPSGRMRANVMLRGPRKTLRVVYSYNMDVDTDDRLAIREGEGVCGVAMHTKKPVVIDLVTDQPFTGSGHWGLSKYQRAMVWPNLRTIFAIPLLSPGPKSEVIGTLNFDSDLQIKQQIKDHLNSFGEFAANKVLALLFRM